VIARFPGDITAQHVQNFLECCHSRKLPNADVYIGHRAASIRKARMKRLIAVPAWPISRYN
jgi:hypothetical protein